MPFRRLAVLVATLLAPWAGSQEADPVTSPGGQLSDLFLHARSRMQTEQDVAFDRGDYPRVIASLRLLAETRPHDEEIWSNLFWMLGNVEETGEAWSLMRVFAQNNPGYADANYHEAQLMYQRRAWAKVVPLLEPAIGSKNPPRDSVPYRLLAQSYYRLKYYEDSLRVSNALLARWPDDETAKANIRKIEEILARGG